MINIINSSFLCGLTEFRKWIANSRMILLLLLIMFVYSSAVEPLIANARLYGEPINMIEPLIGVLNSGSVLLIVSLTFTALIADFPATDQSTAFVISRTNRRNWVLGQIFCLMLMSLSFLLLLFVISSLPVLHISFVYNNWSNVVTGFGAMFPELKENAGAELIPASLFNQMPPVDAAALSISLDFLLLLTIGLLFLFFTLKGHKTAGIAVCISAEALGTAFCSIDSKLMWVFPFAHSVLKTHFTYFFRQEIVPLWFSYLYFLVTIAILTALCLKASKKFNFWNI